MKHYVRVWRPRFEIATVEVDAKDHDEAESKAIELAEFTDVAWVLLPFDGENYIAHAPLHVAEDEIEDLTGKRASRSPMKAIERFMARYSGKYDRYLLLYADTNAGEGSVLFQPWFTESEVDMLHQDIVGDWVAELQRYVYPPPAEQSQPKPRQGRPVSTQRRLAPFEADMADDEEKRIRGRMRKLRELTELHVRVLWDEERAVWLAEIDWSPFAGNRGEGAAVEAASVKEALQLLAIRVDA